MTDTITITLSRQDVKALVAHLDYANENYHNDADNGLTSFPNQYEARAKHANKLSYDIAAQASVPGAPPLELPWDGVSEDDDPEEEDDDPEEDDDVVTDYLIEPDDEDDN